MRSRRPHAVPYAVPTRLPQQMIPLRHMQETRRAGGGSPRGKNASTYLTLCSCSGKRSGMMGSLMACRMRLRIRQREDRQLGRCTERAAESAAVQQLFSCRGTVGGYLAIDLPPAVKDSMVAAETGASAKQFQGRVAAGVSSGVAGHVTNFGLQPASNQLPAAPDSSPDFRCVVHSFESPPNPPTFQQLPQPRPKPSLV